VLYETRKSRVLIIFAALAVVVGFAGARVQAGRRDVRPGPPGLVESAFIPPPVALSPASRAKADSLVRARVRAQAFPGAALAIGNRGAIQHVAVHGRTTWDGDAPEVTPHRTRFDLASLTKVVATTAAVMALVEDGRLELDAPVRQYVPEFSGGDKNRVTVRQLLTHTGGVRAGAADIADVPPARVRRYLLSRPLALEPGKDVLYSDLGFVVLWEVAERAAGEPLPRYLQRRVWGPLGMTSTSMGVPPGCADCAPTLHLAQADEPYAGGSFDEVARRLDGVAGNAGAFSTLRDLATFAALIANEGRLEDVRVFNTRTVRGFTRPQPGTGTRALGWEVYCREGKVPDHKACEEVYAFGHTGVTGTSLWIDPVSRSWVVLLANRTYLPRMEVDMQRFRRRLYDAVLAGVPES
jgi:CubicO group peptidase (beta-lactamase class C family)